MVLASSSNVVSFEMKAFDPDTFEEGGPINVVRWRRVEKPDGSIGVCDKTDPTCCCCDIERP